MFALTARLNATNHIYKSESRSDSEESHTIVKEPAKLKYIKNQGFRNF